MAKVTWFEIPAKNPEKTLKFYGDVFDWKIDAMDKKYWVIKSNKKSEEGIEGGIYLSEKMKTVLNTISVPDFDKSLEKVVKNGGKIIDKPEDMGEWGMHVYFKDPEGTILGLSGPSKKTKKSA